MGDNYCRVKLVKLYEYIKGNKFSILLFLLLFAFSLLFRLSIIGDKISIVKSLFYAFLNSFVLFLFFYLFVRTFLRIPIAIFLSFLVAVDVGLFYIYGSPMNFGVLASIFETDLAEAYSMSKLVLLPGLLALGFFIFLFFRSSIEIKNHGKKIKSWLLVSVIFVFTFLIPIYLNKKDSNETFETTIESIKVSFPLLLSEAVPTRYPFVIGDITIANAYWSEKRQFEDHASKEKILPKGIVYNVAEATPDKIIVVIGESSLRTHYSLYGYSLKTTPFLDSLATDTNRLVYYNNVISPSSFTRDALRISLSFSTARDKESVFDKKNIINLANDAGYETSWLSNQTRFSKHDTYVGMIAANANKSQYLEDIKREDLKLVPMLKGELESGKKQFIIIHMDGSHMEYRDRTDEIDTQALGNSGETIDYDKTIHHTNRVLEKIFDQVKDSQENILIYFYSDHAEIVNKGHAKLDKWKCQYEIPLVIMQNRPLIDTRKIITKYYDDKNLLNMSANPYILAEIMGYQVADSLVEKSKEDGKYIYQVDGSIILYENIKD